jgi:hypothetical protein
MAEKTTKARRPNRGAGGSGGAGRRSAGPAASKPKLTANRKTAPAPRRSSGGKSLIARAERAVPRAVEQAGKTVTSAAKRTGRAAAESADAAGKTVTKAAKRTGQAAAEGASKVGSGLAGTGKYLAAGAVAGAALGAAIEASKKPKAGGTDGQRAGKPQGDDEGLLGLANRALHALGELAGNLAERTGSLAEKTGHAVGSLVKSDSDERRDEGEGSSTQQGTDERSAAPDQPPDGDPDLETESGAFIGDEPDEGPEAYDDGADEDSGADDDEADLEIRSGMLFDESEDDESGQGDEDAGEQSAIFDRPKRRSASRAPEFERNWEA